MIFPSVLHGQAGDVILYKCRVITGIHRSVRIEPNDIGMIEASK